MIILFDSFLEQNYESKIGGFEDFVFQLEYFIENEEFKEVLRQQIENFMENERMVIVFYYYEELSIKEIVKVLGVFELCVSQFYMRVFLKFKVVL